MRRLIRLCALGCAVLGQSASAFAGDGNYANGEDRCDDLGAACVCAEALNTSTHGGGNSNWNIQAVIDPDDSQTLECTGIDKLASSGYTPTLTSSISSILPAGRSASWQWVLHKDSSSGGGLYGKTFGTIGPNRTLCIRAYRRWDPGTQPCCAGDTQAQAKVMTLGGNFGGAVPGNCNENGTGTCSNPYQISWGGGQADPTTNLRFDGNVFLGDGSPFLSSGISSTYIQNHCWNNFCRFEVCLDWASNGQAWTRYQVKALSPGDGITYTSQRGPGLNTITGSLVNNTAQSLAELGQVGGSWANRNWTSHALQANTTPCSGTICGAVQDFWIGAACEVEGGCSGGPPPPTWNITVLERTPASCTQNAPECASVAIHAEAAGTAVCPGAALWQRRCTAAEVYTTIGGCTGPTCDLTPCSYAGLPNGSYEISVRSECEGAIGTLPITFQVLPVVGPPPSTMSGVSVSERLDDSIRQWLSQVP